MQSSLFQSQILFQLVLHIVFAFVYNENLEFIKLTICDIKNKNFKYLIDCYIFMKKEKKKEIKEEIERLRDSIALDIRDLEEAARD